MIRVAEGLGGLALILGLGATLFSLWTAVRDELVAVDRVRILRAELEAATSRAALDRPHRVPSPEAEDRIRGLLEELSATGERLPLATRAVVLTEVREVRSSFAAWLGAAAGAPPDASAHEAVRAALGSLHRELVMARRVRLDRSHVLAWALRATALLLVAAVAFLGHRLLQSYQAVEGANEALEDRLRRRNGELRGLRGELGRARASLHRTEQRLAEAFAQATEAQRARAELEARLSALEGDGGFKGLPRSVTTPASGAVDPAERVMQPAHPRHHKDAGS